MKGEIHFLTDSNIYLNLNSLYNKQKNPTLLMHNLLAVKCTNVQLSGFLQMCTPMWPAPRSTFPSSQKVPSCFFSVITTIILMPTTSSFFILNLISSQSYWYSSVFLHVSVVLFYFIFIFWRVVHSINILYNLFIHSPVDGNLGYFQCLSIIINTYEHSSPRFFVDMNSHLLNISLGVEILGNRNYWVIESPTSISHWNIILNPSSTY